MYNNQGVRALCVGVLHQAARDLQKEPKRDCTTSKVKQDIINGGLRLYLDLLNIDFSEQEFINKARNFKKGSHIINHQIQFNKRKKKKGRR